MLHRGVAWLFFAALSVGPRPSRAQDDAVRVTCSALSPEDAAQVETRTRATLLTARTGNLRVTVQCEGRAATILVAAGDRSEWTTLPLDEAQPRDALLAAIEQTIAALERQKGGATAAFPRESAPAPAGTANTNAPPPHAATPAPAPPPANPLRSQRSSWVVAAGVFGELWTERIGYGARLALERRMLPWAVGASFGWLTTPETDAFGANEVHALLFVAIEERAFTGLRGSLGAGMSVLVVAPSPDLVVRSDTTLPLAFLELGLSRPIGFGRATLLPAVGLRLFPTSREVHVDATRRLALPPLSPSLFLGFGYEI
ncbi:MAG TPA: hypothetical protein VGK73_37405 [Polyangiaceae bacterium]